MKKGRRKLVVAVLLGIMLMTVLTGCNPFKVRYFGPPPMIDPLPQPYVPYELPDGTICVQV